MSFGIQRYAVQIPRARMSVGDIMAACGEPNRVARVFSRLFGLDTVSVAEPGSVADFLAGAVDRLLNGGTLPPLDLVIYAHSLLAQTTDHGSMIDRVLAGRVERPSLALGVSHMNCASSMAALDLVRRYFMSTPSARYVLLIAGDSANPLGPSRRYLPGATVMGDAAVALLLDRDSERGRILSTKVVACPRHWESVHGRKERFKAFNDSLGELIIEAVSGALDAAGVRLDQVASLLPANINLPVWSRFAAATGFPASRIHTRLVSEIGHTYSVDPFISYSDARTRGVLRDGELAVLVNIGLGTYIGASVIKA